MLLELIWRKKTHLAMGVAGGLCAVILLNIYQKYTLPFPAVFFISMFVISAVEMLFGYLLNIKLGLSIWNYGKQKLNFHGQVCLKYSLIWGALGYIPWLIAKSSLLSYQ